MNYICGENESYTACIVANFKISFKGKCSWLKSDCFVKGNSVLWEFGNKSLSKDTHTENIFIKYLVKTLENLSSKNNKHCFSVAKGNNSLFKEK